MASCRGPGGCNSSHRAALHAHHSGTARTPPEGVMGGQGACGNASGAKLRSTRKHTPARITNIQTEKIILQQTRFHFLAHLKSEFYFILMTDNHKIKLEKAISQRLKLYGIDWNDLGNTWDCNLPIYDRLLFLMVKKYNLLI